jgi:Ca-activated chloride channel family protein
MKSKIIILLIFFFTANFSVFAQKNQANVKTRILFIFDESNSMTATWQKERKIDVARKILIHLLDSLKNLKNVELALRMYGHQSPVPPQDCGDTKLEVPFGPNNWQKIADKLNSTVPKGTTPIARSLAECVSDFPPCSNCRNVIILITDGIEACSGDPCAVALSLYKNGITIKPFIIGIGLDVQFKKAFDCLGQYYDANKEEQFGIVLNQVITKTLSGLSTSQINLLDTYGNPKETNINITLYDQKTGKIISNFIHTLNSKGNPDTLSLATDIVYKMTVHTMPEVTVENINLIPGKHNIIKAKTPQGFLTAVEDNGTEYQNTNFIVRKHGDMKTINVQQVFETEKYLTGFYDVEILTLPRIYLNNIEIKQSQTQTINIPKPGVANLLFSSKGYAAIFEVKNGKVSLVCNENNILKKGVQLQPGDYIAVYRPAEAKTTELSKSKSFTVVSGYSVNVFFDE